MDKKELHEEIKTYLRIRDIRDRDNICDSCLYKVFKLILKDLEKCRKTELNTEGKKGEKNG